VHTLYQVHRYGQMLVEKFHGIITPAEMECALKYKLVSWYLLSSEVLTSLIFRVSTLLLLIFNGTMNILLSLVCWNFKPYVKVLRLCFIWAC
jgi:hypothetical protein